MGSTVSRTPVLQTCRVLVVLKQRLASFQHFLILRSPSRTRSCAPNQSVEEFAVELSLCVSTFIGTNSQIHVNRSQGKFNLASLHHCVGLRFSNVEGCQTLQCRSSFQCVAANSREIRCLRRLCQHVLVLEIAMQLKVAQPDIALQVSVERSGICKVHSSRFLQSLLCLGPNTKVSCV